MEKVTKSALTDMKPGQMRAFYVPDAESLNSARVTICHASTSRKKKEGVEKYVGKKDGDIMIVTAVKEQDGCE